MMSKHVCLFALAACTSNTSGNTSATDLGDTSHPLAPASPIAALRAACGDGGLTAEGAATIHRRPYLQQVTTSSARVGWVTMTPLDERVELTTPAGEPLATAPAAIEDVVHRNAGENQMWATLDAMPSATVQCYALANLVARTGFKTAPDPASTETIRFLAFGDSGEGGADQYTLRDQMLRYPYDLILHTGDLAYEDGSIAQLEDNVFTVYAELFANLSFFPAAGNHEYVTMSGQPFRDVFALPAPEKWYSYDWGRIHFAVLDTEQDYAAQGAWLDADLGASTAPWKIVYMHRPMFSSGLHGSDLALRGIVAPILERHHVQLALAGHDHDYERMKPQHGVQYVVTGGGGRGTYPIAGSDFTAFRQEVIHFVIAEVGVDELVLHAIDASGTEFDAVVVPR